jgi:hypothetical protein
MITIPYDGIVNSIQGCLVQQSYGPNFEVSKKAKERPDIQQKFAKKIEKLKNKIKI